MLGYLGELSAAARKQFELRGPTTVAELQMSVLVDLAKLVPQQAPLSPYPAVGRDVNLVVDEVVRWATVAGIVQQNGGPLLESIAYQDTYRDEQRLGRGKKSLLFGISFRSQTGTLTREEVDALRRPHRRNPCSNKSAANCGRERDQPPRHEDTKEAPRRQRFFLNRG